MCCGDAKGVGVGVWGQATNPQSLSKALSKEGLGVGVEGSGEHLEVGMITEPTSGMAGMVCVGLVVVDVEVMWSARGGGGGGPWRGTRGSPINSSSGGEGYGVPLGV